MTHRSFKSSICIILGSSQKLLALGCAAQAMLGHGCIHQLLLPQLPAAIPSVSLERLILNTLRPLNWSGQTCFRHRPASVPQSIMSSQQQLLDS